MQCVIAWAKTNGKMLVQPTHKLEAIQACSDKALRRAVFRRVHETVIRGQHDHNVTQAEHAVEVLARSARRRGRVLRASLRARDVRW